MQVVQDLYTYANIATSPSYKNTCDPDYKPIPQSFALLRAIMGTLAGVTQVVDSTSVAKHSAFFATVDVADRIGQLCAARRGVLGLSALLCRLRDLLTRVKAWMESSRSSLWTSGTESGRGCAACGKKPIVVLLLAPFGVLYTMMQFIRTLTKRAQLQQEAASPHGGSECDSGALTFGRTASPFPPPSSVNELVMKENESAMITR